MSESLRHLKRHLTLTVDDLLEEGNESDSDAVLPYNQFLKEYYVPCDLAKKIKPYLDHSSAQPLLLLGRAGTGKTTILTAVLSTARRPFLRVPYVSQELAVRMHGAEPVEILEEAVRTSAHRLLTARYPGKLIKDLWESFFFAVIKGQVVLTRGNFYDRAAQEKLESVVRARRDEQSVTVVKQIRLEFDAALSVVSTSGSLNTLVQMIAFHLSRGKQRRLNLFIDNIENSVYVHLIRRLLEGLTMLKNELPNAQIVLSMRYSTLLAVEPDSGDEMAQAAARQGTARQPLNVASTTYEVFHIGGVDFPDQAYLNHLRRVLAKRVARFLGLTSHGDGLRLPRSATMSQPQRDLLTECFNLIGDARTARSIAMLANYNLRDIFVMVGNAAETRVLARADSTLYPGLVMPIEVQRSPLDTEEGVDENLNREPNDDLVSSIYFLCGSDGVAGAVGRDARDTFHGQLSRALFDPLCFVSEDVRRDKYPLLARRHSFSDEWGVAVWGEKFDWLRARLVFGLCARELPLTGLSPVGARSFSIRSIQQAAAGFGIDRDFVRLVIGMLAGRGSATNLIDLEMEEATSFELAPPSARIALQPRGAAMFVTVPHRFHFWAGAERHAEVSWHRMITRTLSKSHSPTLGSSLVALLALSHLISLALLEMEFLVERADALKTTLVSEDQYWTRLVSLLEFFAGSLQDGSDPEGSRTAILSQKSAENIEKFFRNSARMHAAKGRRDVLRISRKLFSALDDLRKVIAWKAGLVTGPSDLENGDELLKRAEDAARFSELVQVVVDSLGELGKQIGAARELLGVATTVRRGHWYR